MKACRFFLSLAVEVGKIPQFIMEQSGDPRRHLWLLISLVVIFILSPFVSPYYYGRTTALLEAMLGQFYLVALVGRLVGLHIVHERGSREE